MHACMRASPPGGRALRGERAQELDVVVVVRQGDGVRGRNGVVRGQIHVIGPKGLRPAPQPEHCSPY